MFEHWSLFVTVFSAFMGIGLAVYLLGNRKTRAENMKSETYTCGEPFPKTSVGPENFYGAIKENLRTDEMRRLHSGRLSDYVLWLVVGVAALILMVVLA